MKTVQNLTSHNWYYTQIFPQSGHSIHFVTFAASTKEAHEKIQKHLASIKEIASKADIHLYQKNYKRDSRNMVAAGRYID